ncbi:YeeE/YedE family protein [Thalassotalea marina]|uniref:Membrane protein n=1 Tax=Thalassotalea marina TaxID=1673741 RepID=A0A919EFS9_9GAMM|nr:YeeE/YedE thiosulfate transporter family protein [Thalassotalea marina]GHF77257.1 membrane protein [Thalassotalea marina]
MDWFTPFLPALFGGILIGLSALLLLLALGRIAGISGILANLLFGKDKKDFSWRLVFVAGLILGAAIFQNIAPQALPFRESPSTYIIAIAGFLVGFGTYIGSGCTSGHGVCGIGRFSVRSIVATVVFMLAAIITVYVVKG